MYHFFGVSLILLHILLITVLVVSGRKKYTFVQNNEGQENSLDEVEEVSEDKENIDGLYDKEPDPQVELL